MGAEIDQGTIIYGIHSTKYPSVPCYGVIITARCDIAQCKVPKYYYLVAVDAASWFCTQHGFEQTFASSLQSQKNKIIENASKLNLDGDVLVKCMHDDQNTILTQKEADPKLAKELKQAVKNLRKALDQYRNLIEGNTDEGKRCLEIKKNSKTAVNHLNEIDLGKHTHYYFLPQCSYLGNDIKSKGLIVDLLEIGVLSLQDAQKIVSPFSQAIYYKDLPDLPQKEDLPYLKEQDDINSLFEKLSEYVRLTTQFWLKSDDDFVAIEGTTKSPWCEHLMQRFSNAFVRIGLDNPTKSDFESIIASIDMEETI